jgi:hypothetical protein
MRRQSMPLRFPCIIHCVAIAALIGSAGGAAAQGFQHAVNIERNVSVLSPARGVIDSFEGVNQLLPTKNYVVHVENGDSLSAIVSRLWGLQLTRKKLASLEETVRRENTLIAERSTTSLSLKPGDTLLVPREIDGRVKIDTLVLSSDDVSRNVQPEVLAAASTSALKGNFDVEIASLNPAERCALDKREPFNARAVMDRLEHVRKSTGRVFASPIVAMVDTAINGRFATIKDHIAPPIDDDRFGSESGGANVALALGSDAAMEQAGKPPSEHGIHIAGLILGGPNYLLADISSGSRPAIRSPGQEDLILCCRRRFGVRQNASGAHHQSQLGSKGSLRVFSAHQSRRRSRSAVVRRRRWQWRIPGKGYGRHELLASDR